jgi:ABC-type Mn2+/Zn2+ transport system permease subunit
VVISVVVSLVGVVCGLILQAGPAHLPSGPAMVLVLVIQFVLAYVWSLVARRRRTA